MEVSTENKTESLSTNKDETTNPIDSSSEKKEENQDNNPKSEEKSNKDSKPDSEAKPEKKPLGNLDQKPKSKPIFKKKTLPKPKIQFNTNSIKRPKPKNKPNYLRFILVSILVLVVLGAFGYQKGQENYSLIEKTIKIAYNPPDSPDSNFARESSKYLDDFNFPEYAKKFMPDEKLYEEISRIDTLIPRGKNLGNSFLEDELYESIKGIIPDNIDEYKTVFAPIIKNKISEEKENKLISYADGASLPYTPKMNTFRNTLRYWNLVSRYYDQKRDYDTSLLIIHGIFYLSRDLITKYNSSGFFSRRLVYQICNSVACDSILKWASIPRLNSHKLSKTVAIDILDLVKNEYPFSQNLIYEQNYLEINTENFLKSIDKGKIASIIQSQEYKDMIDIYFKKPLEYIDKPLYELKNKFKEFEEETNNFSDEYNLKTDKIQKFLINLFTKKEMIIAYNYFRLQYPNVKFFKEKYEENLAKMEFVAIALAINSFYCERSRLPSSIGELGNWLDRELPNNRLTNQPYKLNLDGEYLLTNEAVSDEERYYFKIEK